MANKTSQSVFALSRCLYALLPRCGFGLTIDLQPVTDNQELSTRNLKLETRN
jgi:hypothetical protein